MFEASSLGPAGAAGHGLFSSGWLCGFGKQDHPQGTEQLLPCQTQACQTGFVWARPHFAGDAALPGKGAGANQPLAGLLAASLTLPLLAINHLLFKERPSVALSTTWIAYEPPPSMPSPGAGGAGMHMSIRGASTLQTKHATAKPSVPFMSDTAETSKAGENCREPSGEEGASCPTACPGALELQYVGMAAASAGRQRLRGWTAPVDAQKGMPAFIMCHL